MWFNSLKVPTVKTCFGCINLEAAGIFLGIWDILSRFVGIYTTFDVLNMRFNNKFNDLFSGPYTEFLTGMNVTCLLISILWILGILIEKPGLMLPAIIFWMISNVFIVGWSFNMYFVMTPIVFNAEWFSIVAFASGIGALYFYFWIVEYSLYRSMKKAAKESSPRKSFFGRI